jgi:methionyl-tRNA formyltransferase
MKIVFMGTPDFAVPSLRILLENKYEIVGVITAPDKPAGRGKKVSESAVKKFALEKGLTLLQPSNLKDPFFLEQLKALAPDLQIVVAFRMLPESVWNLPVLGTYNLHASLLPKYRGAAPINRAIMNGDTKSGVSTFKLQHDIDSGNILLQEEVAIGEQMNAGELHDLLMERGARVLLKTVQMIEAHQQTQKPLPFKVQNVSEVSHAPKIHKETCKINWNDTAEIIHNQIRGLSPYPAAYTIYEDGEGNATGIKIYKAIPKKNEFSKSNGSLIAASGNSFDVACNGGAIQILELQQEGKKRLSAEAFLRGFKFKTAGKFV